MSNALPDIKAKVTIDSSDLNKAAGAAKTTGATIKAEIGDKATTHTLRFKESLTTLTEHIAKMPPIVGETARSLESMTANAGGMGALGLAGGVAAAGLGLLAEGAHIADEAFLSAAHQTESYMRVTGQSADASSRAVEVFGELGVGADTATNAMVKLDKIIAQHPAHLAALGVEVAKDSKGNTDMAATLGNVADAYNATTDAGAKMNIVLTAFGKSGAAMIPILEQGSAGLRRMEAAARVVMTDADIEQAHRYEIQQKEIDARWESMKVSAGRLVQGPLSAMSDEYLRQEYITKRLSESNLNLSHATGATQTQTEELRKKFGGEYDAAEKAKTGLDEVAAAHKAAADAAAAQASELDALFVAEDGSQHAALNLEKADRAVTDALGLQTSASRDAGDIFITQKEAMLTVAAAAQKVDEENSKLTTGVVDAKSAHQAYIDKLSAEASTLAPGSPLQVYLNTYINKLRNDIPPIVRTQIQLDTASATQALQAFRTSELNGVGVPMSARAGGGPVVAGVPYLVNENTAHSEIFIPRTSGTITPNATAPAAAGGGGNVDVSGIEARLDNLIAAVASVPGGQTGVEAALYKAMAGAALNRARGMAGG